MSLQNDAVVSSYVGACWDSGNGARSGAARTSICPGPSLACQDGIRHSYMRCIHLCADPCCCFVRRQEAFGKVKATANSLECQLASECAMAEKLKVGVEKATSLTSLLFEVSKVCQHFIEAS